MEANMRRAMRSAIFLGLFFGGSPAEAASVPTRVGQCVATKITLTGARLEGAPDSGTTVVYANKILNVDYEVIAAVRKSRVGDPVRLCLVSLPKHCPPGDDRGKFYSARNLRTGGSWKMYDSQHLCGGA
jgi:hypothetical protein